MSKDKEFKAKNRDLDFSKPQKDDTVLGRQNRPEEQKTDLSSSKKNRMYQQRQEAHEQPKTAESVKGTQRKQAEKFRADNDSSVSADNDASVPK